MRDPTFGPEYDSDLDEPRIHLQHEDIRDHMLGREDWMSLAEIEAELGHPQASISAQLRHLRKPRFGSYVVEKRRRDGDSGTWEYRVRPPLGDERPVVFEHIVRVVTTDSEAFVNEDFVEGLLPDVLDHSLSRRRRPASDRELRILARRGS